MCSLQSREVLVIEGIKYYICGILMALIQILWALAFAEFCQQLVYMLPLLISDLHSQLQFITMLSATTLLELQ